MDRDNVKAGDTQDLAGVVERGQRSGGIRLQLSRTVNIAGRRRNFHKENAFK